MDRETERRPMSPIAVRAVVLDLDGTLLNSEKQVSARNLAAVLTCRDAGIRVLIATARPPRSLRVMLPEALLAACDAIVCYNGALLWDGDRGYEAHLPLPDDVVRELCDFVQLHASEALIACESNDRLHASRTPTDDELTALGVPPEFAGEVVVTPIEQGLYRQTTKLLLPDFPLQTELLTHMGQRAHTVVTDGGRLVQIMHREVSKQEAVRAMLNRSGIGPNDVMAFGDDYNDAGLLAWCGYPVAMGNAVEPLRRIAARVTTTNDEDGVALVLEELLAEA